jgi:hypothetical protein
LKARLGLITPIKVKPSQWAPVDSAVELWAKQLEPEGDGEVEPEEQGRKGKKEEGVRFWEQWPSVSVISYLILLNNEFDVVG